MATATTVDLLSRRRKMRDVSCDLRPQRLPSLHATDIVGHSMEEDIMIEVIDDSPIRDFIIADSFFLCHDEPEAQIARRLLGALVEAAINLDEQVLGVDEDGHAILGIERQDLIGALLVEMRSGI